MKTIRDEKWTKTSLDKYFLRMMQKGVFIRLGFTRLRTEKCVFTQILFTSQQEVKNLGTIKNGDLAYYFFRDLFRDPIYHFNDSCRMLLYLSDSNF